MRLLSLLIDLLFPPRDTERIVREISPSTLSALCAPRTRQAQGITYTALLPYRHRIVRALILEAKFRGNAQAQALLAGLLRATLTSAQGVLIPIPLSAKRLRARGYNQTEEIARQAAQALAGVSVASGQLARTRHTVPQTSLRKRDRRENIQGAFRSEPADPSVTYIVLDDVVTTGATLRDAARALREAGASRIELVALAH